MLDDLLGRTALKERIAVLEEENAELQDKIDDETRRRKQAVTEKQDAEREINKLESKIAELEGRLEQHDADGSDRREFRVATQLRSPASDRVLSLLGSVRGDDGFRTVLLPPGAAPPEDLSARLRAGLQRIDADTGRIAVAEPDGVVEACLVPPIRVDEIEDQTDDRFHIPSGLFAPPSRFVLAVVRSDAFAAGLYVDGDRDRHVVHSTDVKSDHGKGGFSQDRFERIRDEQIAQHLEASYGALDGLYDQTPDRIAVVGDRGMASDLADELDAGCPVQVGTVDARGSGVSLLEDGREAFWSSRLYVL